MTTLLDYCEFIVDCEHKTAPLSESGYPSIRTPNVGRGRLILQGVNRVDEDTYRAWTQRATPQPDDLIIAREAPVGNVAIVPKGAKVCLGQRTVLVRPDKSKVNPAYLCYYLLGDYVQGVFHGSSGGATVPHLNMKDIRGLPVPRLPSLETQNRISSILSAYDDLLENNTRRIAILEEMARRIYEEWFVRFRFPGHEQVRMVESELGLIPEGWRVAPITKVSTVKYGKNLPTKMLSDDGDFPVYGASKVIGRFTEFTRQNRTLIVGCRGSVGVPQITLPRCFVTNNSFTVDPAHPKGMLWLFHALQSRGLKDVVGGAAQPQITLEGISNATLITPVDSVIEQFAALVQPLSELAWNLGDKNANLRVTRDLLLPKLISGELDVSTLPEPQAIAA